MQPSRHAWSKSACDTDAGAMMERGACESPQDDDRPAIRTPHLPDNTIDKAFSEGGKALIVTRYLRDAGSTYRRL